MWIDDLTENEKEVLKVAEYEGDYDWGFSYEVCIWNYMEISEYAARGALSSLVKKGILSHQRQREDGMLWNIYRVINPEHIKDLREYFKEN